MKNKTKIFLPLLALALFMGGVSVAVAHVVSYNGKGGCTLSGTGAGGGVGGADGKGKEILIDLGFGKTAKGCLVGKNVWQFVKPFTPDTGTDGGTGGGTGGTTQIGRIAAYFESVYPITSPAGTR